MRTAESEAAKSCRRVEGGAVEVRQAGHGGGFLLQGLASTSALADGPPSGGAGGAA